MTDTTFSFPSDSKAFNRPLKNQRFFSSINIISTILILVGSGMQSYANMTFDATIVAMLILVAGIAVVGIVFSSKLFELQGFLLTYSVCVFVGGMAQCYSLAIFNNPQSTIDAFTFLNMISPAPPFRTMENMPLVNSPLAVFIWQQAYKFTWYFGFKFGPYTGVLFNAFVMGLSASITVRIARTLFGNDNWRLKRVIILFATCGLFILFGAVLIRDCFTTFLNTLVLLAITRWLVSSTNKNLITAIILIGVSAYFMVYLRFQTVLIFGIYTLMGFLFWILKSKINLLRLIIIFLTCFLVLISIPYVITYTQFTKDTQNQKMQKYAEFASTPNSSGSLGLKFVVKQPLPIRLIMGSGALMINPIPLWASFRFSSLDYHWIKGYNGIYQVIVFPLVIAGSIIIFRSYLKKGKSVVPLLFLVTYFIINLLAVVATSLEQRHIGQFMPAFILIAAFPDTRELKIKRELIKIFRIWFSVVILVHIAWVLMKSIA